MNPDGSHGADNKNKFKYQFDVYYCCAMIGMAAVQLDEDAADLKDLTESYPKLEEMMLRYLSDNETMLSEEGIKTLNAYALRGYQLIHDFPLEQKPTSREEFLEAFHLAIQTYQE